jgi:hypothetical protein
MSCWRCHLGTPALPPASQTGICSVMTHVVGKALLLCSTSLPVALLLYLASAHSNLAFNGLAKAAMAFFWRCAGVLARIALASLPASSCPCHQCCTSIIAEFAFKGLADAVLAFAGVVLAFCPHHAGVIASTMLSSLSPVLRRRHCPCCVGAFTLVALGTCPCCLCLVSSIANWRLPSREIVATRARVIASTAPLLLPA